MKRILLLAKRLEERALLAANLHARGFHVTPARDEESAMIVLAARQAIDLAIISLPDCDSQEFLSAVRKHRMHLPVILMTNCDDVAPLLRNLFPGVISLPAIGQWYDSRGYRPMQELDRQIRLVLHMRPAFAA